MWNKNPDLKVLNWGQIIKACVKHKAQTRTHPRSICYYPGRREQFQGFGPLSSFLNLFLLLPYFQHLQMKCLSFTFAFHCVPSLHGIGSVLNLFLLLPYLPFYFRERPIHFHFTTSVIRLTRKWKGSGNSGQTKAQERTHPSEEFFFWNVPHGIHSLNRRRVLQIKARTVICNYRAKH